MSLKHELETLPFIENNGLVLSCSNNDIKHLEWHLIIIDSRTSNSRNDFKEEILLWAFVLKRKYRNNVYIDTSITVLLIQMTILSS